MEALALIASSLLVVPSLDDTLSRRMNETAPASAATSGKSAASLIRVVVAPSGGVEQCETLGIAGDEQLGAYACTFVRRIRLEAPRTAGGDPTYGVVETIVKFVTPGTPQAAEASAAVRTPDLTLGVQSLPDQAGGKVDFYVLAQVSPDGAVSHCEGAQAGSAHYAALVCSALQQNGWNPVQDKDGNAITYVTRISARFTEQAG